MENIKNNNIGIYLQCDFTQSEECPICREEKQELEILEIIKN